MLQARRASVPGLHERGAAVGHAGIDAGAHDWFLADDGEQAAFGFEFFQPQRGYLRERAAKNDGIEFFVQRAVFAGIAHHYFSVADVLALEVGASGFSQLRVNFVRRQFPDAELVGSASSSRAAEMVGEESQKAMRTGRAPDVAAIGSELAGQIYGLNVLCANIEDNPDNITRFFVISRQMAMRSGDDKTSIMFATADKPGALVHVLQAFERHSINLTHIEKRPSGKRNWTYTFFVDAQGHREDPGMAAALADAKPHCRELAVLGSYPRAKRIL